MAVKKQQALRKKLLPSPHLAKNKTYIFICKSVSLTCTKKSIIPQGLLITEDGSRLLPSQRLIPRAI